MVKKTLQLQPLEFLKAALKIAMDFMLCLAIRKLAEASGCASGPIQHQLVMIGPATAPRMGQFLKVPGGDPIMMG